MQSGNNRPFISQDNVRTALERLLYSSSEKTDHPLLFLLLIDQFLANPDLPPLQDAREFALRHVLTSLITDELSGLYTKSENAPFVADAALGDALAGLAAVAQTQSPESIGWNWLYYRYVRVDLNLSSELFSQVVHVDERTLRRYQQHAIKRLTDRLTYMEWQARVEQRKRRLYQELPGGAGRSFIGREGLLTHLDTLVRKDFQQKIYLTGAAGIGKTSLVRAFLVRLIDDDAVDQILWIQQPGSIKFIQQILSERLLPEARNISLREYLLLYRVVIVVDDVMPGLIKSAGLAALLAELDSALLVLISQHFTPIPGVVHLTLPEFTQPETESFFRRLLESNTYFDEFQPDFQEIWQQVGGNPLALQLIVQNRRFYGWQTASLPSVEQLYNNLYTKMDDRLKQNWFMLVLFPNCPVSSDLCLRLWPAKANREAIITLRQWHMLETIFDANDSDMLSNAARRYIKGRYQTDSHAHALIEELVNDLEKHLDDQRLDVCEPVEYLLLSEWFEMEAERRDRWIRGLWSEGLKRGRWTVWRTLFETASDLTSDPVTGIAYSLCLRKLGEWDKAQENLQRIIMQTGRAGQFLDQARAMLELAILLRGKGEYKKADGFLSRSKTTAARNRDEILQQQVELEQAQTELDARNLHAAFKLLTELPASKRTLSLLSEVYLASDEPERSQPIIEHILSEYDLMHSEKARLFTLLGRSFEKQNNLDQAKTYFSSALTLLETQHEPFALARAQANMAALLIQEQLWEEAHPLLEQAEATQTKLNDRVALQTTRHNLRLVKSHFAG